MGCESQTANLGQVQPATQRKLARMVLPTVSREKFASPMPEAYQRLLLDVINGDASLFARSDEVETAWSIVDPIQSAWDTASRPQLLRHEPGLRGPVEATEWMERQGRSWFDSCPVLH
jgi:glucose-6-phosphate 1-dehydrogenase